MLRPSVACGLSSLSFLSCAPLSPLLLPPSLSPLRPRAARALPLSLPPLPPSPLTPSFLSPPPRCAPPSSSLLCCSAHSHFLSHAAPTPTSLTLTGAFCSDTSASRRRATASPSLVCLSTAFDQENRCLRSSPSPRASNAPSRSKTSLHHRRWCGRRSWIWSTTHRWWRDARGAQGEGRQSRSGGKHSTTTTKSFTDGRHAVLPSALPNYTIRRGCTRSIATYHTPAARYLTPSVTRPFL